jgi:uncharacterized OB-fold protein
MSWGFQDEIDAARERDEDRRRNACRCGNDMPGRCPGPAACPMCSSDDDEEEDASDEGECQ